MTLLRRAILALTLIAGFSPAFAQAPGPVPALPDTERRTSYSLSASTCSCNVNFAIFGEGQDYGNWIEVWVNGVNVPQFGNWSLTSPSGAIGTLPRPISDAVLTFNNAQTGTVQIVGARRPRRISQFAENRGVAARDLNQVLTDIIAQNRETWDKTNDITGRGVFAPPGETLNILAAAATRANSVLGFDAIGQLGYYNQASQVTAASNVNFLQLGTGAISRTVQDELRDTIKAAQFGMKCDGFTNDSGALQAAVTFADSIGGPTVVLPVGTCLLNSNIFLNKWIGPNILTVPGMKIKGQGKGVTILDTRVASGYAISVNPAWKGAFQALSGMANITGGGSLGTGTYWVQITMNDPLGNEIFVTLPNSVAITGPNGRVNVVLPATNSGYTYNLYIAGPSASLVQPANYGTVSGLDGKNLGGSQTVNIDALGGAHAVPATKIATNQNARITDLSITNSTAASSASGVMLFKAGYAGLDNVIMSGLTGNGLDIPNYTGDADGSFNVSVTNSKFDNIAGTCVNAAGTHLELSNFRIEDTVFNLCGTLPANYIQPQNYGSSGFTVSTITNSTTPVVTTSVSHTLAAGDQVYLRAVAGMTLADGWYRACGTVAATTYQLCDLNGNFIDTTALGAYTASSGRSMLAWRPPTAASNSGALVWMGLIGTFRNLDFTQNKNFSMYFTEAGSSDNATIENIDFENTYGKGLYAATLIGGTMRNFECLSAAATGPTIACAQLGTGMASGGVSNFQIGPGKIRSDVTPATQFEQFKNTNNSTSWADSNRVSGVTWQVPYDAAGQNRFNGFNFDPIPGTVRFSISAQNTVKLLPTGLGCTLPLHSKATGEWVPFCVPDTGLTLSISAATPGTTYNVFVANNSASTTPPVLVASTSTTATGINGGYSVLSSDSTKTFVGTATTDGAGNFQTTGAQTSRYPVQTSLPITMDSSGIVGCPNCVTNGAGAMLQGSPADPTGATAEVMMGLGSTCKITPLQSTRVHLEFQGQAQNATGGGIVTTQARYGTGVAPANAAAVSGTTLGSKPHSLLGSAANAVFFRSGGNITGLTVGTAYWFDLAVSNLATGTTATVTNISCDAFEIP